MWLCTWILLLSHTNKLNDLLVAWIKECAQSKWKDQGFWGRTVVLLPTWDHQASGVGTLLLHYLFWNCPHLSSENLPEHCHLTHAMWTVPARHARMLRSSTFRNQVEDQDPLLNPVGVKGKPCLSVRCNHMKLSSSFLLGWEVVKTDPLSHCDCYH